MSAGCVFFYGTNEYLLCEAVPAVIRPLICELGKHLRTQQEYINEQKITVTDYEHYVENWVHEIKKPLSLMTLLLDNRKDEMSPLVHIRDRLRSRLMRAVLSFKV